MAIYKGDEILSESKLGDLDDILQHIEKCRECEMTFNLMRTDVTYHIAEKDGLVLSTEELEEE